MRASAHNGEISVRAIAGTHTVLLGMDASRAAAKGLLGFAIRREDHTENEAYWLRGLLTFRETDHAAEHYSVFEQPIQDFKWGDYTAKPDHRYSFTVIPVYGQPKRLEHGEPVTVEVETESETDALHHIYFNRGVAASQAYESKFGTPTREELERPGNPASTWLSRGLEEAIIAFIGEAKGKGWALRASLYEFAYLPVLEALHAAHRRGADVKVVFDDKGASAENRPAITKAGIGSLVIPRKGVGIAISHNKFMLLLRRNQPVAVWTGSTNIAIGGILGQSNVGHAVWDRQVASAYLDYWDEISGNPSRKVFSAWNDNHTPVNLDGEGLDVRVVFSPRGSLEALNWYKSLMDGARFGVFLTAAFGVSNEFTEVLVKKKRYLRYILMDNPGQVSNRKNTAKIRKNEFNRIALGNYIHPGALADWHAENLTQLNEHVRYVHTKYMLIDPLSDHPIVISGSANFSEASTTKNDENMLVIRNNTRVADIYVTEFMRLFSHFYFRHNVDEAAKRAARKAGGRLIPRKLYLGSDDSWTKKYYRRGTAREKERLYFAGTPR